MTITLNQMYSELQAVHGEVRDMRQDLRMGLATISDHESRLRTLERRVWIATGAAGIAGSLVTVFMNAATGA